MGCHPEMLGGRGQFPCVCARPCTLTHAHTSHLPSICPECVPPHMFRAVSTSSCSRYLARETEAGKAPPPIYILVSSRGRTGLCEVLVTKPGVTGAWGLFTVTSRWHHQFLLPLTFCPQLSMPLITYRARNAE